MKNDISQKWFFQQQPSDVWEYLTRPELIEKWLMKSDFQPIEGHKFCFTFDPKPGSRYAGTVECEVLVVKPFTKLSYTWNGTTQDKSRSFHSTVVWTLVPKENGTELQLQHNGFEFPDDMLNHANGWNSCLNRFHEHINTTHNENANA